MRADILKRCFIFVVLILSIDHSRVYAQTDTWIPANPVAVVPNELSVFSCNGKSTVNARWVFRDGGFRVVQQPVVSRNAQTISLDARVEEWTGGRTLALVPFQKNFDIGALEPGTYTLHTLPRCGTDCHPSLTKNKSLQRTAAGWDTTMLVFPLNTSKAPLNHSIS